LHFQQAFGPTFSGRSALAQEIEMSRTPVLSASKPQRALSLGVLATAVVAALWFAAPSAAEQAVSVPPPARDEAVTTSAITETAVLAGGCFWGVQGVFQHVQGVSSAVSGYSGGAADTAQYESVGYGRTGHAESVRITFDPKKITYGKLLQIYFSVAHNPTELNRQGPDTGTQYRSTIFPSSPEQTRVAQAYIEQLNRSKTFGRNLATTVEPLKAFYPAEATSPSTTCRRSRAFSVCSRPYTKTSPSWSARSRASAKFQ
jgi:peptide-methionine (S)-S-oxide reductase